MVGAGPGDPGLLTRRGAELLGEAEVVIYDFLANPELQSLAPAGVELIFVGKKAGEHTLSQNEINKLIIEKAASGRMVVRLKGGDPFIFGRGGEEAEALVEAGLDFEVVPGVSSALAGPAYAGIPLTHRSFNAAVTLATGHEDPTKPTSKLNWAALAQLGGALVFLMGVKNLAANAQALMDHGLAAQTPTALVEWGTTTRQRCLVSTLEAVAREAETAEVKPPTVWVVGEVVRLRERLAWLEKRPLWGLKVLVTRAREGASRLAEMLRTLGAEPIIFPTIALIEPADLAPLRKAIADLAGYDWLIFTSANTVKHFFKHLAEAGRDLRALGGVKLCAIGPGTARELAALNLKPEIVPADHRAEGVVAALEEEARQEKRFLLPRAQEAPLAPPPAPAPGGGRVDVVAAYRSVLPEAKRADEVASMLKHGQVDVVVFTASSTVKNMARLFRAERLKEMLARSEVAVIGPVTAQTAREAGLKVAVEAQEYTLEGLLAALIQWQGQRARFAV